MSSFCKSPGKHCHSELLITMPFFPALSSLVLFILKLYPQNSKKKKTCTRPQNPHKQCTCKSTTNAKKAASAEETTHNQQEMWCQHPTNGSTDLFFLLLAINSPIDLHSIHVILICLTLGSLLVTSAEMHNVEALKEQPKSLGWCAVAC